MIQGAARDLADVGSTFAARLRVSIGHEAKADAIDKFHKLAVAMKNLHTIITVRAPEARKNEGGRPRKTGRKRRTARLTIDIKTVQKKKQRKTTQNSSQTPGPQG